MRSRDDKRKTSRDWTKSDGSMPSSIIDVGGVQAYARSVPGPQGRAVGVVQTPSPALVGIGFTLGVQASGMVGRVLVAPFATARAGVTLRSSLRTYSLSAMRPHGNKKKKKKKCRGPLRPARIKGLAGVARPPTPTHRPAVENDSVWPQKGRPARNQIQSVFDAVARMRFGR